VRSLVLFLKGTVTEKELDEIREGTRVTSTGIGRSGGVVEGRVEETIFSKRRHLFPM